MLERLRRLRRHMTLPATTQTHHECPAVTEEAPVSQSPDHRVIPFHEEPDRAAAFSDTTVVDVVYPFQNRLGGLANQLAVAVLASVILTMIVFPASFRGSWKTALAKILYWLY